MEMQEQPVKVTLSIDGSTLTIQSRNRSFYQRVGENSHMLQVMTHNYNIQPGETQYHFADIIHNNLTIKRPATEQDWFL